MPFTEDELFAKGRAAIVTRIEIVRKETKSQLTSLRDHYETGHDGRHPVQDDNGPLEMLYKIMGDQVLDMQFLRAMDSERFSRLELVYWVNSALAFAAVKDYTGWKEFTEELLEGVDKFCDRQMRDLDKPIAREMIVRTGIMIADTEAITGRLITELGQ